MTGDADADTFQFSLVTDTGLSAATRDIVTDFAVGVDKLKLSAIDANTLAAGDQAFSFIGTAGFTSVAGQLHAIISASGQVTVIEGDTNGDGKADYQFALFGALTLTAADFVL